MNPETQSHPLPSAEILAQQLLEARRKLAEQRKHLRSLNRSLQNKELHISNLIFQRTMWMNRSKAKDQVITNLEKPWYKFW